MARLLSQSDVEKLVTMKDIVEILDKTYRGMGEGTVVNPAKGTLDLGESGPYPPYHADINSMPAYVGWVDTAGIKWAGGWMDNPAQGLPYVSAIIVLVNPRNGIFTGVMDGTLITNLRTGAQTAVALKYLYPGRKSLSVGLFGAGVQGRTQTRAITELFAIDELKVYDTFPEAARKFAADMESAVSGKITICSEPQQAAEGDAVITVTHAKDGFFKKEWFASGTVLFPMGSYKECQDEALLSADSIVVDHVAQCLHRGALKDLAEAGRITESSISATLGELAAGKKRITSSPSSRILCIPIGTGAMDVAAAAVVLQRAEERGIGRTFDFAV
ncbi:MAG: ornithine cyclodeaminase family protein [Synergistales bacterium]|nr:ornithine cyclodeaminase family protein [Synergistales bacterium]